MLRVKYTVEDLRSLFRDKMDVLKVAGSATLEFRREWGSFLPTWRDAFRFQEKEKKRQAYIELNKMCDRELNRVRIDGKQENFGYA